MPTALIEAEGYPRWSCDMSAFLCRRSTAPCGCLRGWIERERVSRGIVSLALVLFGLVALACTIPFVSVRVESCHAA